MITLRGGSCQPGAQIGLHAAGLTTRNPLDVVVDGGREALADKLAEFTNRLLFESSDMRWKNGSGMMRYPHGAMQDTGRDAGDLQCRQGFTAG